VHHAQYGSECDVQRLTVPLVDNTSLVVTTGDDQGRSRGKQVPLRRNGDAQRIVVIGLGRFGRSVATTLHGLGYGVVAIDIDERAVNEMADSVTLAAQGDGSDEELLRSLQVDRAQVGIVAQGRNLEANLLATLALKRLGVPWVVAKATSDRHGELLERIGANRIVFPERDEGLRIAHSLAVPSISDYISLSPTSGVAKFAAPDHFHGRSIGDLHDASDSRLSILLIKRATTIITNPGLNEHVQPCDELVVGGPDEDIESFVEATPAGLEL
jgi:trk system potassium uptake protein TrkA